MKYERNPNIELWRCFCMFAVVLGHVLANNRVCSMNGFLWHIPGFLLISGYFGVRFSFKKILKLVGIAYGCYWLTIPLRGWTSRAALLLPHGGWFLPFYCFLLIISPVLNSALENERNHRAIFLSVLVLVFIGWIPTLVSNLHVNMLAVSGMQGSGLLLMLATYVLGAMLRKYDISSKRSASFWLMLFVAGIAACIVMGFFTPSACHYLSPISLLTAAAGLMFFIAMPQLPSSAGKIVNFLAPSMFGIFILHECCLRQFQSPPQALIAPHVI